MLGQFDICRPGSVAEASAIVAERGDDAVFYAGGTELLILMKERLLEPALLVDIKTIPGLDAIALDPGGRSLLLGGLATHRAVERSPLVREALPELAAMEAAVANVRVRHAGTLGGNLCFAEPHSDPATLLVALDAVFTLASASGARDVPAADFCVGFLTTVREPEELLARITIPLPGAATRVAYERFKTHERPDASAAATLTVDDGVVTDARIAIGSVGERPTRVPEAERALIGQAPSPDAFAAAADLVRDLVEPTEDPFASSDYKRHLARTLTLRALARAGAADGGTNGR